MSRSFLITVIVASLIMAGLPYLINIVLGKSIFPMLLSFGAIGMGLLTLLLHSRMIKAEKLSPGRFIAAFMGSTSIKLFSTMIFIGAALYTCQDWLKAQKISFAMGMFVCYAVFTVILIKAKPHHPTQN